jgi:hypothetical protein
MADEKQSFDDGDTNETYIEDDGKVVKEFKTFSATNIFYGVANLCIGVRWRFLGSEKRIQNEIDFAVRTGEFSITSPVPERRSEDSMAYDYVKGNGFDQYARESPEEAAGYAERIGDYLAELRREGIAAGDVAPENFIISEDVIFRIDNEWANLEPDGFDYWMENVHFLKGLLLLPSESFDQSIRGLDQSDFHGFRPTEVFAAAITAPSYSLVFDRSPEKAFNSFRNLYSLKD